MVNSRRNLKSKDVGTTGANTSPELRKMKKKFRYLEEGPMHGIVVFRPLRSYWCECRRNMLPITVVTEEAT